MKSEYLKFINSVMCKDDGELNTWGVIITTFVLIGALFKVINFALKFYLMVVNA